MNILNIHGIMYSKVWKKIEGNKGYRGCKIIDTARKPGKQRCSGQFFVLLIFFSREVRTSTILKYHKECCCVPKRDGYEGLDTPEVYDFYGTMKMVTIS